MVERRSLMENNLRRAVKTEEFELHYQPQMDLHTGRIIGLEALLRWRQDGYLVGPAAFIPIAEEIGLIVPLGKWVLQAACEQARRWKDAGLPMLPVAVNVSAAQLDKQGFVDDVFSALASTGVEARALKLELTESTVMQGTEEVISLMNALQRKGIKLAIDDFGVGYSSLSYLKRFPIDTLKIDQSFIHDLPNDEDDVAITQAVIRMAQSLRLHVVAEGVETVEQMDFLRRNECAAIQGNYFCAPMPAESVEPFLRHHYSNHEAQALTKFRH
jgi:EAL domain-containing protein (putative c-di-GMP-specific phosphodiesterase class I)